MVAISVRLLRGKAEELCRAQPPWQFDGGHQPRTLAEQTTALHHPREHMQHHGEMARRADGALYSETLGTGQHRCRRVALAQHHRRGTRADTDVRVVLRPSSPTNPRAHHRRAAGRATPPSLALASQADVPEGRASCVARRVTQPCGTDSARRAVRRVRDRCACTLTTAASADPRCLNRSSDGPHSRQR
jgi:hypothetical protein